MQLTIQEIHNKKYRINHYDGMDQSKQRFALLTNAFKNVDSFTPGLYLEFGVDTGATLSHIARHFPAETIYGFDSFYGLPENWIPGFDKGKFNRHGQPPVKYFNNVEYVVGLFQNTLPAFLQAHNENIAFLHIDCDLYSSTDFVLRTLQDRIVTGTIIVFDELINYVGYENHEFKAFNEFLERTGYNVQILATNEFEQVAIKILDK